MRLDREHGRTITRVQLVMCGVGCHLCALWQSFSGAWDWPGEPGLASGDEEPGCRGTQEGLDADGIQPRSCERQTAHHFAGRLKASLCGLLLCRQLHWRSGRERCCRSIGSCDGGSGASFGYQESAACPRPVEEGSKHCPARAEHPRHRVRRPLPSGRRSLIWTECGAIPSPGCGCFYSRYSVLAQRLLRQPGQQEHALHWAIKGCRQRKHFARRRRPLLAGLAWVCVDLWRLCAGDQAHSD